MKEYLTVIRNRQYLILLSGQGVSTLGSKISYIGLTWLVLQLSDKAIGVGILLMALSIPSIIIGPIAGVLIERWSKKKIIVATNLIQGAFALGIASSNSIEMILLSALLEATCNALLNPSIIALVPRIIGYNELVTANALVSAVNNISGWSASACAPVMELCRSRHKFPLASNCPATVKMTELRPLSNYYHVWHLIFWVSYLKIDFKECHQMLNRLFSAGKAESTIHVGEAYVLWSQLRTWYDVQEFTEAILNYVKDADLKLVLEQSVKFR